MGEGERGGGGERVEDLDFEWVVRAEKVWESSNWVKV